MAGYQLTWLTKKLAIGHAPMSLDDLDYLHEQEIDGIINLCGEYCDLHELEEEVGFGVYYLPIEDENAPDPVALQAAIDWMASAIERDKKILVHCRFGKGRTATFVSAYLLQQGHDYKKVRHIMKECHCLPTSFSQWRFLRRMNRRLNKK